MKTTMISLLALSMAPAALAANIDVTYSAEFQQKLENDYGVKEGAKLTKDIREDLEHELEKIRYEPARIEVTILDAKPNRPTMGQLSNKPGLDMLRSKSVGGMELSGIAYDASGSAVAELQYDWFETSIEDVMAMSVWGDANRASRKFARKLADELAE
jgi:hypothetical protein